jgi:hypothetical protein
VRVLGPVGGVIGGWMGSGEHMLTLIVILFLLGIGRQSALSTHRSADVRREPQALLASVTPAPAAGGSFLSEKVAAAYDDVRRTRADGSGFLRIAPPGNTPRAAATSSSMPRVDRHAPGVAYQEPNVWMYHCLQSPFSRRDLAPSRPVARALATEV